MGLAFAFLGSPLAWFLQLTVNYALASYACYPQTQPLHHVIAGWESVRPVQIGLNLGALAIAVAAALTAEMIRRGTQSAASVTASLAQPEISRSRAWFLASWGTAWGLLFLGAIVFNLIAILMVPLCAR